MKQTDFKDCALCGKGVMHSNQLTFFRVQIEHMAIVLGAVQRQAGLEMMLGGNAQIAHAMGPQEDMAQRIGDVSTMLVCQQCGLYRSIAELLEVPPGDAPC